MEHFSLTINRLDVAGFGVCEVSLVMCAQQLAGQCAHLDCLLEARSRHPRCPFNVDDVRMRESFFFHYLDEAFFWPSTRRVLPQLSHKEQANTRHYISNFLR